MSSTQPPCRGNTHYFSPPTGLHSGQVCSCGERYGETIDGKFRMHVTAPWSASIAGEVACTPGARYEVSGGLPRCRFCGRSGLTEYQFQIWDDEHGERTAKFYACSEDQCRTLAEKDVGDARMNCERRATRPAPRASTGRRPTQMTTSIRSSPAPTACAGSPDPATESLSSRLRRHARSTVRCMALGSRPWRRSDACSMCRSSRPRRKDRHDRAGNTRTD